MNILTKYKLIVKEKRIHETIPLINKPKKEKHWKQTIPLLLQSFWILFYIGDTIRTHIKVDWFPICSIFLYKTDEHSRLYTLQCGITCTGGLILQPTFYCTKLIEANKTLYRSCNHKFFNYSCY